MSLIRDVISGLNDAAVEYVVVGGIAVVLHGRGRLTLDLDLVIRLDDRNIRGTLEIVGRLGLQPRLPIQPAEFLNPATREQWIGRGMQLLSFFDPISARSGVDLFTAYPIDFDQLTMDSVLGDLNGVSVRVCSLDHLIEMKKKANRPINQVDVTELEMIRARRRHH